MQRVGKLLICMNLMIDTNYIHATMMHKGIFAACIVKFFVASMWRHVKINEHFLQIRLHNSIKVDCHNYSWFSFLCLFFCTPSFIFPRNNFVILSLTCQALSLSVGLSAIHLLCSFICGKNNASHIVNPSQFVSNWGVLEILQKKEDRSWVEEKINQIGYS